MAARVSTPESVWGRRRSPLVPPTTRYVRDSHPVGNKFKCEGIRRRQADPGRPSASSGKRSVLKSAPVRRLEPCCASAAVRHFDLVPTPCIFRRKLPEEARPDRRGRGRARQRHVRDLSARTCPLNSCGRGGARHWHDPRLSLPEEARARSGADAARTGSAAIPTTTRPSRPSPQPEPDARTRRPTPESPTSGNSPAGPRSRRVRPTSRCRRSRPGRSCRMAQRRRGKLRRDRRHLCIGSVRASRLRSRGAATREAIEPGRPLSSSRPGMPGRSPEN